MAECCTVSVVNWKGGVGKTTLTHHLAVGLQVMTEAEREEKLGMRRKPRVLLIDNDAQCNLTISCLGSDKFEKMVERGSGTMRELYATFLRDEDPDSDVEEFIVEGMVRKSKYENYEDIDVLSSHPDLIYGYGLPSIQNLISKSMWGRISTNSGIGSYSGAGAGTV